MGQNESRAQDLISKATLAAAQLKKARRDELPGLIAEAQKIFDEISDKIKQTRFSGERLAQVQRAQQQFSDALKRSKVEVKEIKQAAELEAEIRKERERKAAYARQLLEDAETALWKARSGWKIDLERAGRDVARWADEKPTPDGVRISRQITAEYIADNLAAARTRKAKLEELLTRSGEWSSAEILEWYREVQEQSQAESRERKRQVERIASKQNDPRLLGALEKLKDDLGFDVARCQEHLLSAEITEILCAPIRDNGESAALERFVPVTAGVGSVSVILAHVKAAKFPVGTVKNVIERLIEAESQAGAGSGARLRSTYPKVVVKGNAAGFNINHEAVISFFRSVAIAITAAADSDSGSRLTTVDYAGEVSAASAKLLENFHRQVD